MTTRKYDWCVVYRTGGTQTFKWHRTLAMTEDQAEQAFADTIKMGYHAFIESYSRSVAIGLPDSYSYQSAMKRDF